MSWLLANADADAANALRVSSRNGAWELEQDVR
jgi:hypothetical protein